MSKLRGKIADILDSMDAIIETTGHDYRRQRNARADRILALIAEAMLRDSAVIAAENAGQPDSVLGVHHHCGTDAVQAALAAAGITPGDAREGGEGDGF